jgi:hypothetical protein
VAEGVVLALSNANGNTAAAARFLGVSREVLAHRAHKFGIGRGKAWKKWFPGTGNSLPRIDTTFDLDEYKKALKKNPEQSACKFCSNMNGNKRNLTCIKECPFREIYAQAQMDVDVPAHPGVSSFAKMQLIIPKGRGE